MKEQDILRAIGDIDDSFILEPGIEDAKEEVKTPVFNFEPSMPAVAVGDAPFVPMKMAKPAAEKKEKTVKETIKAEAPLETKPEEIKEEIKIVKAGDEKSEEIALDELLEMKDMGTAETESDVMEEDFDEEPAKIWDRSQPFTVLSFDQEKTEAMPKAGKKQPEKTDWKTNWKLWAASAAAVLVICIGIGSFFAGSFSGKTESADTVVSEMSASTMNGAAPSEGIISLNETESSASAGFDTKLIKRTYVYVQTVDMDMTQFDLKEAVENAGGYFESSNEQNGGYYSDGSYRWSDYGIRIPVDAYDSFISQLTETFCVSSISENTEDITDTYYDTQGRLESLQAKRTRLQQLLSQAQNLSDVLTIESEINDTEYEIENYTSQINRYNSQVDYAFVDVSIEQVDRTDGGINQSGGFFSNLGRSLTGGVLNFFKGVGGVILWAAYHLIGIALIAGAVIVIYKKRLISKLLKQIRSRREE